jgi:hypothetical protein
MRVVAITRKLAKEKRPPKPQLLTGELQTNFTGHFSCCNPVAHGVFIAIRMDALAIHNVPKNFTLSITLVCFKLERWKLVKKVALLVLEAEPYRFCKDEALIHL